MRSVSPVTVAAVLLTTTFITDPLPAHTDATADVVIPTNYAGDRFFATPVTQSGDTMTLFLDTGDMSRVWDTAAARFRMELTGVNTTRGPLRVAKLPVFHAARSVPDVNVGARRVIVTPPTDRFDTLMSSHTYGQLGANWFADRIWSMDYPQRRLTLLSTLHGVPTSAHKAPLAFPTDPDGQRVGHSPGIVVEIDGDSLSMLFDTGATVWLTDAARTATNDGGPTERATSLAWLWLFNKWRQRHPEWRVLEKADSSSGESLIEVPSVRIAGFDVGPVWFRSLKSASNPPPPRPSDIPLLGSRISGTIGGNVFRHFQIYVDYPKSEAWFVRSQ